ncbi:EI24 domain-containing protein [Qipengyuania nanhaisediminis]|uniref:EI24 domain-containing protein n=1 Tax=Qipengyuania nanhaisediminis TaxID=604088 RepID=UPI0038B3BE27
MSALIEALAKAVGQLADRAVLRVLAKTLVLTLLAFVALAVGLYHAIGWLMGGWDVPGSGLAEAAAAAILAALAAWFLFRVVALAVLQFFADEVVAAVEARHFPDMAAHARPLPLRRDLANSLRGAGRAIGANLLALPVALVLLVTGIGPALVFLGVNAWLLGRELTDMAWLRHCDGEMGTDMRANPVGRGTRLALGAVIAALLAVPVVNLLAPVIGAAAGTHLAIGAMARKGGDARG